MRTADFHFDLPPELVAQAPLKRRDQSRLLVLRRPDGNIMHRRFPDLIKHLHPGDLLVLNDSKVIPARLHAVNAKTDAQFEILLVEPGAGDSWWALVRPAKRARLNTLLRIKDRAGQFTDIVATVTDAREEGQRLLRFDGIADIEKQLMAIGAMPVPPYIHRTSLAQLTEDFERYQTVYAKAQGSVAAPTAGLHFTVPLLDVLRGAGIHICCVTLHVGPGTFAPVRTERVEDHALHEERYCISEETAKALNAARAEGRRIIAVGTTSLRVLESVGAENYRHFEATQGRTRIFIHPPFRFRIVDALLTNFHLPCSTLLMLVSAFVTPGETSGRALILRAYAEAIRERYRFFSYGDAMLIL